MVGLIATGRQVVALGRRGGGWPSVVRDGRRGAPVRDAAATDAGAAAMSQAIGALGVHQQPAAV
jgi:hypothetical protein